MPRKAMTKARRARILDEHGRKCHACQCEADLFHIDHWVPLMLGGSEDDSNLRPLCEPCHARKTANENRVRGKINRLAGRNKKKEKRKWPQRKLTSRGFEYAKGSRTWPRRPKRAD